MSSEGRAVLHVDSHSAAEVCAGRKLLGLLIEVVVDVDIGDGRAGKSTVENVS